ncbi:MAG: UDP-N-acetylmuramate dehydrogenase [Brachymonas sp.]|nr:UDP-N-acetylmuramate dehydrogenase [Brachymonas sp.]
MKIEENISLDAYNTFGIAARARHLLRVQHGDQLTALADPAAQPLLAHGFLVLGGGSNIILTGDARALVLKMENRGMALVDEDAKHWIVQAAAGETWHDLVAWSLQQGYAGLENLALIPGSVGAAPVQNIGAYGLELQDRFHSLDAVEIATGRTFSLDAAQCGFGYRDSVFKHTPARAGDYGLAGQAVITQVRLALPKVWKPELGYLDIQRKMQELGITQPTPQQVFNMVVAIRRAKLPDPAVVGNAGSFFKNPVVSPEQCADIIAREPNIVHYPLPDGTIKLAAGWLIDACGWRGKSMGNAGVYPKQALVLVNRHAETGVRATGGEVMTLARAIQTSVYERFGIRLEMEPVVV